MAGFIKKIVLNSKQAKIRKTAPGLNIVLHPDMPQPSMAKIAAIAGLIQKVNALEDRIKQLTDAQLKAKTAVFKEHILKEVVR